MVAEVNDTVSASQGPATFVLDPLPAEETMGQWLFRYSVIRSWRLGCPGFHWQEATWTNILFWSDLRLEERSPRYSQLVDGVTTNPTLEEILSTFPEISVESRKTSAVLVTLGDETIRYPIFRRAPEDIEKDSIFYQDEICFVADRQPSDLTRWQSLEIPGEASLLDAYALVTRKYPGYRDDRWKLKRNGNVQYLPQSARRFWHFWK